MLILDHLVQHFFGGKAEKSTNILGLFPMEENSSGSATDGATVHGQVSGQTVLREPR
jgi:hypothetical protein